MHHGTLRCTLWYHALTVWVFTTTGHACVCAKCRTGPRVSAPLRFNWLELPVLASLMADGAPAPPDRGTVIPGVSTSSTVASTVDLASGPACGEDPFPSPPPPPRANTGPDPRYLTRLTPARSWTGIRA